MLILWISWKKTSCSQNFEEETATKTPAPLQIRTLSAQEIIKRENLRERTREGTRALSCAIFARSFPKTPKTGFFSHQYQRDVISQNSHNCAKYLYSSVTFFGVAFVISEVLYWHPLQLYKARWAKAFASNLIPRALFLQFSCNITFWEESGFVAMGALITRATDPRFRENK